MKLRNFLFVSSLVVCMSSVWAQAATYNYYFSNATGGNPTGNDSIGDGTIGSPWASLNKAKTAINSLASTDTANLYFDRGDTWSWSSAAVSTVISHFTVSSGNPEVNIDAYGIGDKPKFDGLVNDFSIVPVHNATTGPMKWNRFFEFQRDNCNVSNIEITRVYGHAIYSKGGDNFTVSNCDINNFGSAAFAFKGTIGLQNSTFEYSTVHTGQQLYRYKKRPAWGGGIEFANSNGTGIVDNNYIHHNVVYDIYGEGIVCSNALTEYNIVGDTGSIGIDPAPFNYDSLNTTVRYNLVTFSDRKISIYDTFSGSESTGIRVMDENELGDNSSAVYRIYGNVIINRDRGIWFLHPAYKDNAFGKVEIYDNLVIDSLNYNYVFSSMHQAKILEFHGNSSIFYDRVSVHINDGGITPPAGWTISGNHFWTNGETPKVDSNWRDNYNTSDPKLLGGTSVDWIKQTGPTYFLDLSPKEVVNPPVDSPIFDLNPLLPIDINEMIQFGEISGKISGSKKLLSPTGFFRMVQK